MKSILFALLISATSVFGQGLISFQNGTFQKFYVSNGGAPVLMGTAAQAYTFYITWGTSAGNLNNSTLGTPIYNSTTTAGLLAGNTSFSLTGSNGGDSVFIKMYAFETSYGSYANAIATGGHAGSSTIAQVTLATAPSAGTVIFANTADANHIDAFLIGLPEPSTFALGCIGITLGLVFTRRNKLSRAVEMR